MRMFSLLLCFVATAAFARVDRQPPQHGAGAGLHDGRSDGRGVHGKREVDCWEPEQL